MGPKTCTAPQREHSRAHQILRACAVEMDEDLEVNEFLLKFTIYNPMNIWPGEPKLVHAWVGVSCMLLCCELLEAALRTCVFFHSAHF